ncbi:DUF6660 family protein [Niabella drilacis]|uniref:DUF6660 family protein n=1 Tax=Niabella drilacis (strain DSM 25811 / CCM 8410 / CCUG 62505 / LMG 26954 / E90) TaxID=1285928 RepID=UPI00373FC7A0
MKFFALLFVVYLLAVSVMPCSDGYSRCNTSGSGTEMTRSHDHPASHRDICGPFCICSCCGATANFAFQLLKADATKAPDVKARKFLPRDFFFISNYYGNIWQPPKIS